MCLVNNHTHRVAIKELFNLPFAQAGVVLTKVSHVLNIFIPSVILAGRYFFEVLEKGFFVCSGLCHRVARSMVEVGIPRHDLLF